MAEAIKKGDVVRLKSGGPKMTVTQIGPFGPDGAEEAKCVWFDGVRREDSVFDTAVLVHAKDTVGQVGVVRG